MVCPTRALHPAQLTFPLQLTNEPDRNANALQRVRYRVSSALISCNVALGALAPTRT